MQDADEIKYDVTVRCPHCRREASVKAVAVHLDHASMPVVWSRGSAQLDWSDIDMEAEFDYVCSLCGETVACSLDELRCSDLVVREG